MRFHPLSHQSDPLPLTVTLTLTSNFSRRYTRSDMMRTGHRVSVGSTFLIALPLFVNKRHISIVQRTIHPHSLPLFQLSPPHRLTRVSRNDDVTCYHVVSASSFLFHAVRPLTPRLNATRFCLRLCPWHCWPVCRVLLSFSHGRPVSACPHVPPDSRSLTDVGSSLWYRFATVNSSVCALSGMMSLKLRSERLNVRRLLARVKPEVTIQQSPTKNAVLSDLSHQE